MAEDGRQRTDVNLISNIEQGISNNKDVIGGQCPSNGLWKILNTKHEILNKFKY